MKRPIEVLKYELHISQTVENRMKSALIHMTPYEVSWFGIINKKSKLIYELEEINFPPQICKSTFVETDDEKYPTWFFNTYVKEKKQMQVRLHGHSHPTFAVFPSATDTQQFKGLMNEVNDYFIQFIVNNKLETYCVFHDKKNDSITPMKVVFTGQNDIALELDEVIKKTVYTPVVPVKTVVNNGSNYKNVYNNPSNSYRDLYERTLDQIEQELLITYLNHKDYTDVIDEFTRMHNRLQWRGFYKSEKEMTGEYSLLDRVIDDLIDLEFKYADDLLVIQINNSNENIEEPIINNIRAIREPEVAVFENEVNYEDFDFYIDMYDKEWN